MCGRFSLFAPQPSIEKRFGAEFLKDWEPLFRHDAQLRTTVAFDTDGVAVELWEMVGSRFASQTDQLTRRQGWS